MMGAWPSLLAFYLKPGLPGSHVLTLCDPEFKRVPVTVFPFPLRNSEVETFVFHSPMHPQCSRTVSSRAAVLNLPSDWVVDGFLGWLVSLVGEKAVVSHRCLIPGPWESDSFPHPQ